MEKGNVLIYRFSNAFVGHQVTQHLDDVAIEQERVPIGWIGGRALE